MQNVARRNANSHGGDGWEGGVVAFRGGLHDVIARIVVCICIVYVKRIHSNIRVRIIQRIQQDRPLSFVPKVVHSNHRLNAILSPANQTRAPSIPARCLVNTFKGG